MTYFLLLAKKRSLGSGAGGGGSYTKKINLKTLPTIRLNVTGN